MLFTITATTGGLDQAQIAVLDLRTMMQTTLFRGGTDAHYVPSGAPGRGHLVYGAAETLRAVAFDLARLAVVGAPVPVVPQVVTRGTGGVDVAVAGDGTLVYVPGIAGQRTLAWVDRQGQETPIPALPRVYDHPRISPDGARVAVHSDDEDLDIWLWDVRGTTLRRVTSEPGQDIYPVWTTDSRQLYYTRPGLGLVAQAADGTGDLMQLTKERGSPTSLSPDGTRLVFHQDNPKTGRDVMQLRLDGTHQVTPLVHKRFDEQNGDVSPDGRWLAYEADDSGQIEIYVQPFPVVAGGGLFQVSTGGGRQPLWARNKNSPELFYLAPGGALMRVGIERGTTWAATVPAKLLDVGRYYTGIANTGAVGRNYDIAPDGQRFLMIKPAAGSESTNLIVVQHFDEELKRLVPTN